MQKAFIPAAIESNLDNMMAPPPQTPNHEEK